MIVRVCDCCNRKIHSNGLTLFDRDFCYQCSLQVRKVVTDYVESGEMPKPEKRKPIDWNKACALSEAGWTYKMIASELGCAEQSLKSGMPEKYSLYAQGVRFKSEQD